MFLYFYKDLPFSDTLLNLNISVMCCGTTKSNTLLFPFMFLGLREKCLGKEKPDGANEVGNDK